MANKKISVFSSNLDKIKEKYMDYEYDYNLKKEDINWLIEQAERVQELEEINTDAITQIDVIQRRNERLEKRVQELEETVEDYKTVNKEFHQRGRKVRKQNKRYREALEFYADKGTVYDRQLARKALED